MGVADHLAKEFSVKFREEVVKTSAEKTFPKLAKKCAAYGVFAAMAYTSLKWLYLKDRSNEI